MQIPRYWAQTRLRHETGLRHGATVQRWGWSNESVAAAETHARDRAQAALDDLLAAPQQRHMAAGFRRQERLNDYGINGETPIREEILKQRGDIVMTRNSYGAHCLNTPNVAIADVDTVAESRAAQHMFPVFSLGFVLVSLVLLFLQADPLSKHYLPSWVWIAAWGLLFVRNLWRWLRSRKASQNTPDLEAAAVQRVTAFSDAHPDWGLRVYKTPKGLRVIVTHRTLPPAEPEVQQLFSALQVDPIYARLCRQQQCFRARVTAKPWRIGISGASPQVRRWPVAEGYQQQRAEWNHHYDTRAADYCACRLLAQLGAQSIDAAVQPLIDWHDIACRAEDAQLQMA